MRSRQIFWNLFLAGVFLAVMPGHAGAVKFDDGIPVMEKKEIAALSDEQLVDTYIDVLVEMEASRTFHTTSGFTPKEYQKYKDLLKYRLLLLFEINRRQLALPPSVD